MITRYSMVRLLVSISKPRTVFPKEISCCLKKTGLCSKALEASTVFSYWSAPDAFCSIWISCRHFEHFHVFGNKGPLVPVWSSCRAFLWSGSYLYLTPHLILFLEQNTYMLYVTSKTKKAQQTSAYLLVIRIARWSNLSFTWRGPLDPKTLLM